MSATLVVEFHSHTIYSRDSLTRPERLVETCRRRGIDRVVVTDHNTIAGALAAQKLNPERVIVGEEILTTRGEILAAFVTEAVPAGLEPREVIHRLREQGAFISLAHPFDPLREHWSLSEVLEMIPLLDAIEVFNARALWPWANRRARDFAREYGLPGTVGSDAHAAFELGRALMTLPQFDGAEELRKAIVQARVEIRRSPLHSYFSSRYASLHKLYFSDGAKITRSKE